MSEQTAPESIPEETTPEIAPEQSVPMSEVEAAAEAQGWSPDKGELNALEFLAKGREFRDRLYDEVKELRHENQEALRLAAQSITKQDQRQFAQEQKTFEQQVAEAKEAGDVDKVEELYKNPPQAPAPVQTENTEQQFFEGWLAKNDWFNNDPAMRKTADGFLAVEVANDRGQVIPSRQIPAMMEQIKKIYPDKFTIPDNNNAKRGVDVEKGGTKKIGKKGLQRSDLTEDEAAHFDQFVKSGIPEEKLLASIEKERSRRG